LISIPHEATFLDLQGLVQIEIAFARLVRDGQFVDGIGSQLRDELEV
jgi:hypothetical protein